MNISTVNKTILETGSSEAFVPSPSPVPIKNASVEEKPQREKAKEGSSMEETRKMAEELNDTMASIGTDLGFYIREDLGNQVVVEIKNKKTDELIKQIPSEEMLKIMQKMEELTGLIFDQRV